MADSSELMLMKVQYAVKDVVIHLPQQIQEVLVVVVFLRRERQQHLRARLTTRRLRLKPRKFSLTVVLHGQFRHEKRSVLAVTSREELRMDCVMRVSMKCRSDIGRNGSDDGH